MRSKFSCGRPAPLCILMVGAALLSAMQCQPQTPGSNVTVPEGCPTNSTSEHVLAVGEPVVTVIEYGDIQCPVCGRFARETYPTIKQQYIDTGKIRWVFRHVPLRSIHANAEAAAQASECAHQQGKFFEFVDAAFQNQSELTNTGLKALASQIDLDRDCFDPCLDSGGEANRVQQDVDTGLAQNVSGTPTFFINETRVIGYQSVAQFSSLLDQALAAVEQ